MACRLERPRRLRVGTRARAGRVRIVVETVDIKPRVDDKWFTAPSGTPR